MGGRELEICENCGQPDYPWGGCPCDDDPQMGKVLTCQTCKNDYIATGRSANGMGVFKCEWCNDLRADQIMRARKARANMELILKPVEWFVGLAFVFFMLWLVVLSYH